MRTLVRSLVISMLIVGSGSMAQASILEFLSDIFGGNSNTSHNTPQEQELISYSPDRPPEYLDYYEDAEGNMWGVLLEPNSGVRIDSARNAAITDCRMVNSTRTAQGVDGTPEGGVFIPTASAQEWEMFVNNHGRIGGVTLGACARLVRLPGACRHIQSVNYDNRSQDPAYLMTCTRTVSLAGLPGMPAPGEAIGKMRIVAQIGSLRHNQTANRLETSGTNTLCGANEMSYEMQMGPNPINVSTGNGAFNTTTVYTPGENPTFSHRTKYENNSKYTEQVYTYDASTQTVTVTHNMNGWGNCRREACSACVGDITVVIE